MGMYDVEEMDFELSDEMNARADTAMNRTWDAIAGDCLDLADNGEMLRDEVVEMVLDADRLSEYGGDHEAARYTIWVKRFKPEFWETWIKQVFSSKVYGY